jgi:hypothetical protein
MNAIIRGGTVATVYAATPLVITIAHALVDKRTLETMQRIMNAPQNSLLEQRLPWVHIHTYMLSFTFPYSRNAILVFCLACDQ